VHLVDDLLDVSRLDEEEPVLFRSEVLLDELARDVVSRFEEDAARSGCQISVEAGDVVAGNWDASRLDQVVTNLLTNALKFGAGKPIAIRVEARDHVARLVVEDHGIGIDPVQQQKIFNRFERAGSSRHFGGLGLGLYISRRLVEAHHGTISVASQPDAGATFTVELPFARGADEAKHLER
jgi:signal transduction histidine kinase